MILTDRIVTYKWGHGTIPPWFGIGPVLGYRDQVIGVAFSFGRHCIAFHRKVTYEPTPGPTKLSTSAMG